MAHFRGSVRGSRGEATRIGSKRSGLKLEAYGYAGRIITYVYNTGDEFRDTAEVHLCGPPGQNWPIVLLYRGPLDSRVQITAPAKFKEPKK